jgi:hypothetical protein
MGVEAISVPGHNAPMLELSAVLSSDSINRYGSRFATGEMVRSLAGLWRTGLPNLVMHDSHRLQGWTLPTCVSFEPGVVRLHGRCYVAENGDEMSRLDAKYQVHLAKRIDLETKAHLPTLRAQLAGHLNGDEKPHTCGATAFIAPGLARRVAPKLFVEEDKDGLVDMTKLTTLLPGIYKVGDVVVFAHPYLRRSLSRWNNLNASVLERLESMRDEPGASVRVRLDPDMVGLASSVTGTMELDYWFGPKFNDDLTTIPTGVSRHEASDRERHFFGISRTEFWWQSRDEIHTFEAEELRDLPTIGAGDSVFGCRYVHSMVEEKSGRVVHLDGAIRAYSEESLLKRIDESIATAGKKTDYTKLWRVDGVLPLTSWKALIADHFRDNPLVGEYLSCAAPQEPAPVPDAHARPPPHSAADVIGEVVPHSTAAGNSVRLLVSFHDWAAPTTKREVVPLEALSWAEKQVDVVDADVTELRKAVRRLGDDLALPPTVARLAYEDRYLTFPLVRHADSSAVALTLDALRALIDGWRTRGSSDRVLAFSVAAPFGDQELRCAAFGHLDDMPPLIEQIRALFLCQVVDEVAAWLERLREAFALPQGEPEYGIRDKLITPHETFRMERTEIRREDIDLELVDGSIRHRLRLPIAATELLAAVESGRLAPAFAWLIERSSCSRCAHDYFTCGCSKVLDPDVTQNCGQAQIAYAFWTDRAAHH